MSSRVRMNQIFWHATTINREETILLEGLKISSPRVLGLHPVYEIKGIYLMPTLDAALIMAATAVRTGDISPGIFTILQVTLPSEYQLFLDKEMPHAVYVIKDIPPENIMVIMRVNLSDKPFNDIDLLVSKPLDPLLFD